MNQIVLSAVLLVLALVGIVLRKTYFYTPVRELKRRAARHDPVASKLYRAVAYGNSLRGLLWLYIGLTGAASFVVLARALPIWASLLIVGPLLWIASSLIPETRQTSFSMRVTLFVTPAIAWLLNYLHRPLSRSSDIIRKRYTRTHTELYEREDLLRQLEELQWQEDSQLSEEELEIVRRALTFDEHRVIDILIPRKRVKSVLADDTIGPVLIDELHTSGQDYVLVREDPKSDPIGILAVRQLGLKSSGKVRSLMSDTIYYLHEQDDLATALHAFFKTNCPMFAVVNSFEEYTGIVTIEGVMRQLMGHIPGDDFDQFSDPAAVAARHPQIKKAKKPKKPKKPPEEEREETESEEAPAADSNTPSHPDTPATPSS
jgi:CBS domain containing-hemolysin-like protein